jgi:hypothetical protein
VISIQVAACVCVLEKVPAKSFEKEFVGRFLISRTAGLILYWRRYPPDSLATMAATSPAEHGGYPIRARKQRLMSSRPDTLACRNRRSPYPNPGPSPSNSLATLRVGIDSGLRHSRRAMNCMSATAKGLP